MTWKVSLWDSSVGTQWVGGEAPWGMVKGVVKGVVKRSRSTCK